MNILTNTSYNKVTETLLDLGYDKTIDKMEVFSMWDLPSSIPNKDKMREMLKGNQDAVVIATDNTMYKSDWKLIPQLTQRNTIWYFGKEDYIHIKNSKVLKFKGTEGLSAVIWKINESIKREKVGFNVYDHNLIEYWTNKGINVSLAKTKIIKLNSLLDKKYFKNKVDEIYNLIDASIDTENMDEKDIYKIKYLYIMYLKDSQDTEMLKKYYVNNEINELESEWEDIVPEFQATIAIDRVKKHLKFDIKLTDICEELQQEFYSTDFIDEMFSLDN